MDKIHFILVKKINYYIWFMKIICTKEIYNWSQDYLTTQAHKIWFWKIILESKFQFNQGSILFKVNCHSLHKFLYKVALILFTIVLLQTLGKKQIWIEWQLTFKLYNRSFYWISRLNAWKYIRVCITIYTSSYY